MITLQWNENFMEFLHEDLAGSESLMPVFSIHNGESQWKQLFALFSPSEKLFYWISAAGCECCDRLFGLFGHASSVKELTTGNAKDAKKAVRELLKASPGIISDADKVRVFSKINKFA